MNCRITHIGTATLLLEIGPIRSLTDPVFDSPGGKYYFGYGTHSKKLTSPAMRPEDIGKVDAILLSHDQHEDNLDRSGRAFLPNARQVLTTTAGAKRLNGQAIGSWVKQLGLSWNGLGKNRERFTSLVIRSGSVGFVRSPNIFGSVPRSFILGGQVSPALDLFGLLFLQRKPYE